MGLGVAPPVRRPQIDASFGSSQASAWSDSLVLATVEAGFAPGVDVAELVVAAGPNAPSPAVGDSGSVALGYEDSGTSMVFTGEVQGVRADVGGTLRVTATNGGAALARTRVEKSYEQQSAGDVVNDLAGAAGVTTGTVQQGIDFAFYVLSDRRNAYAHVAELARRSGHLAYFTPQGELTFAPYTPGPAAQSFAYAVDVLAHELTGSVAAVGEVTTIGEGAAGSNGADAWSWLVVDPSSVTGSGGSGDPARLVVDASLRSAASANAAAGGIAQSASLLDTVARLWVPGCPDVAVGSTVEVSDAPDGSLNGSFLVRSVRHRFSRAGGLTSVLDLSSGVGGGAL